MPMKTDDNKKESVVASANKPVLCRGSRIIVTIFRIMSNATIDRVMLNKVFERQGGRSVNNDAHECY